MTKREHERAVFEAFLRAMPGFAGEPIRDWQQPGDEKEFPDVVCTTDAGHKIGVELGQWLDAEQMRNAKGMDRIQESILAAVGTQGQNTTENVLCLWLSPKPRARVRPDDVAGFRAQLFDYIRDVDQRWIGERSWQRPEGFGPTPEDFSGYSMLRKYLVSMRFFRE